MKIREGSYDDLGDVFRLVCELAEYEKEPEAVITNLEIYQRDFKKGLFETLIAETDGEVTGMMLFYMTYSTWKGPMLYLEDFVISQSHRRQGIGAALFDRLLDVAKEKEVSLLKWQVLDWNTPAIDFYKKYKSIIETRWLSAKILFV